MKFNTFSHPWNRPLKYNRIITFTVLPGNKESKSIECLFLSVVFFVCLRIRMRIFTEMLHASCYKNSLANSHLIWNFMSFKSVYVGRVVADTTFCNLVRYLGLGLRWWTLIFSYDKTRMIFMSFYAYVCIFIIVLDIGICVCMHAHSFKTKAPRSSFFTLNSVCVCVCVCASNQNVQCYKFSEFRMF